MRGFPAGVGPDSPSRYNINWMFTQFSPSVETRRRFGCLSKMSNRCASSSLWVGDRREGVANKRQVKLLSRKTWQGATARAGAEGSSVVDEPGEY